LRFAKANPDRFVLECYGGGSALPFVQSYLCENIRYHGQFESPGDLMSIYDSVDISYVVYDVSSKNVRLALPTKLYESAFFRVPILCCEGTSLEKTVVEWGIGMSVPIASYEAFAYRMETIDHD
jgi:hypothetical protein